MTEADEEITRKLIREDALRPYLERELGDGEVDLAWERHLEGHSNETFFLRWGTRDLVLRRPPLGPTLPTAHDVLREHRVLHALQGTDVPVPGTVLACEDESVLGKPFYLMERVPGPVPRTELPAHLDDPANRERLAWELVDTLARIHTVDLDEVGLRSFGRGEGYTARQVERWTGQMNLTLPNTEEVRTVEGLRTVAEWLADHAPEDAAVTLVHGDYKLDNVVVAPEPPARVAAVLDWEMSTLGDPLADLGWMLTFWHETGDPGGELLSILPTFTSREGFPDRDALVARYAKRTGLPVGAAADLRYHRVLALFKLATLLEMSFARHLMGTTDDPFFREMEWAVPALADRALDLAEGRL